MTTKTVRVRIFVIIDSDGKWTAMGDGQNGDRQVKEWAIDASGDLGRPPWAEHWVEADVPLPVQLADGMIEGVVKEASE